MSNVLLVITGDRIELPPHHTAFPDIADMVDRINDQQTDARGRVLQFCCDWPVDGVVYIHNVHLRHGSYLHNTHTCLTCK